MLLEIIDPERRARHLNTLVAEAIPEMVCSWEEPSFDAGATACHLHGCPARA
jgi:hypothetical protein